MAIIYILPIGNRRNANIERTTTTSSLQQRVVALHFQENESERYLKRYSAFHIFFIIYACN